MDEINETWSKLIPPNFLGKHQINFIFGGVKIVELIGATIRPDGSPMYLYDVDGTIYNYYTILSHKKI